MKTNESLFDRIDGEEITISGNEDPMDKIVHICNYCLSVNGEHDITCQAFYPNEED